MSVDPIEVVIEEARAALSEANIKLLTNNIEFFINGWIPIWKHKLNNKDEGKAIEEKLYIKDGIIDRAEGYIPSGTYISYYINDNSYADNNNELYAIISVHTRQDNGLGLGLAASVCCRIQ